VGSNVGGIKFTVRDGETGYLVPPNDPDALAERLAHLYRHPRLASLIRRQAIRRANDLFTWQKVASGVAALYEEVLVAGQPDRRDAAQRLGVVDRGFEDLVHTLQESRRRLRAAIVEAADAIASSLARDGKLLVCGNGGSAADAQHLAGELVGRFKAPDRPGLPAVALTADGAVLTAWANDVGFESVFARQVEALGRPGDVLLGISTSGRSRNVVRAFETARRRGLRCIALLGGDGGQVQPLADLAVTVPTSDTQRVQEVQIAVIHLLCELVEARLSAMERTDGAAVPLRTPWHPVPPPGPAEARRVA
jgi:phosphoheptose isomerase